jgi:hypothetical protein
MCKVLHVSQGGYYTWLRRQSQDLPPAPREVVNRRLSEQIWAVFQRSRSTYGSPRIHAELLAQGWTCSRNRVARLMKRAGIAAKRRRLYKVSTTDSKHSYPVAPNLLNRQFSAARPNEKWLTDITYVPTKEGWLYPSATLRAGSGDSARCLLPPCGWVGYGQAHGRGAGRAGFADGHCSPPAGRGSASSLR